MAASTAVEDVYVLAEMRTVSELPSHASSTTDITAPPAGLSVPCYTRAWYSLLLPCVLTFEIRSSGAQHIGCREG